ncbi:MAG: ATP-dependent RNA helicase RhlE [Desulforhopalus sp.]|jgi:ATP-dependent RNA helicase RhlE
MSFNTMGLSEPILRAVEEQGYTTPTPIQEQAIPVVLEGKDLMAAAQTGTGKTAGFALPILEKLSKGPKVQTNQVRTLILTPTRELAAQIDASVVAYGKYLPLRSTVVFGGVKINPQMMILRRGVDILVATPGRLLDLYNQNAVRFKQLEILVLDEADRMLDMGFIHDIKKILALLPKERQTLMYSATFSEEIRDLAKKLVKNPVQISVTPRNTAVKSVKQWLIPVDKKRKAALLIDLIKKNNWEQALVFTRTKHGANKLTQQLEKAGITAMAIHGNKSQNARTKALADFKAGKVRILVATDIAARGLDIDHLPQVVNFDLPNVAEDYIHRIGRTGRAGSKGQAVSLVSADEFPELSEIEYLVKQMIPREYMEGFEPVNDVPASRLDRPKRAKKPKKPKVFTQEGQRGDDQKKELKPQGAGRKSRYRGRK